MEHPYGILTLKLRPQVDALLGALQQRYAPAAVYCYGLRLYRALHTGCFAHGLGQEEADLDLLLIDPGEMSRGHDMQDFASVRYTGGSVNILCHSLAAAQLALERGHFFFTRVVAQGHLLHGQALAVPAATPAVPGPVFEACAQRAEAFYATAAGCRESSPALCLFLLHQAAEQALCGLVGRHTGYRAATHNLGRLLRLCQNFTAALDWFARGSSEEHRRFILLQQSYSAARYGSGFDVSPVDAACLQERVRSLLDQAQSPDSAQPNPIDYEPFAEAEITAAVQDDLRAVEP